MAGISDLKSVFMKRFPYIFAIIVGLVLASCSTNKPEFANSIPDNAVAVVALHPMQIHTKGQLDSFETQFGNEPRGR